MNSRRPADTRVVWRGLSTIRAAPDHERLSAAKGIILREPRPFFKKLTFSCSRKKAIGRFDPRDHSSPKVISRVCVKSTSLIGRWLSNLGHLLLEPPKGRTTASLLTRHGLRMRVTKRNDITHQIMNNSQPCAVPYRTCLSRKLDRNKQFSTDTVVRF